VDDARPGGSIPRSTPGPEAERQRALFATLNVDFVTFFTPDQMTDVLRQAGFRQIEHFTYEQDL
jgi:hypothetical protein